MDYCNEMCCQMSLQRHVKGIAIYSICVGVFGAIFGPINLLMSSGPSESSVNAGSIPCKEIVEVDCIFSFTSSHNQTMQSIHVVLTAFQLFIDIPTSVLLLVAANVNNKSDQKYREYMNK